MCVQNYPPHDFFLFIVSSMTIKSCSFQSRTL